MLRPWVVVRERYAGMMFPQASVAPCGASLLISLDPFKASINRKPYRTVRYRSCEPQTRPKRCIRQAARNKNVNLSHSSYRQIAIGEMAEDAVTVGIEKDANGQSKAAVWWEAKGDIDADEAEFRDIAEALAAAEAARTLHGFREIVVALQDGIIWQSEWGQLQSDPRDREPVGDITGTDLSENESYELAASIEAERDA
jgi:hypothetical protein